MFVWNFGEFFKFVTLTLSSFDLGSNMTFLVDITTLIQSLFPQWFVNLMDLSLFSLIILIVFLTCRLRVIYVREDNYSNL